MGLTGTWILQFNVSFFMKLDYGQRGEEVREGSPDIFSDTKRKAT